MFKAENYFIDLQKGKELPIILKENICQLFSIYKFITDDFYNRIHFYKRKELLMVLKRGRYWQKDLNVNEMTN